MSIELLERRRALIQTVKEKEEIPYNNDYIIRVLVQTGASNQTRVTMWYDTTHGQFECFDINGVQEEINGRMVYFYNWSQLLDRFVTMSVGNRFGANSQVKYARLGDKISNDSLFYSATGLKMVDIMSTTPLGTKDYMFKGCKNTLKLIRVPYGCGDVYKANSCYSEFSNIIVETKKFNDFLEVYNSLT